MKHAKVSSAWRPVRAHRGRRAPQGVLSALIFNLCLLLLPIAGATAAIIIARDNLYAYEYSDAGARVIRDRVARLNGELIQLDFDRQRQWDDLVAMELMAGDVSAARGFLLSGGGMLPARAANVLSRARTDTELEVAALQLLTPSTRARYEEVVPLLSRRAAGGAPEQAGANVTLANERDFELMARALIAEPETDPLQFILTGFSLGLAGDISPRMAHGAVALLAASRRDDYPHSLAAEAATLFNEALPLAAFRAEALNRADGGDAGAYANAAAAFRAVVNRSRAARARAVLDEIGAMGQAMSVPAAVTMVTHAVALSDLTRLRLVAQAAGDRAAAAAKRLPRDGRLMAAARGQLTYTRELTIALGVAAAALASLVFIVLFKAFQAARRAWARFQDVDDYGGELIDISTNNWRPL